MFRETDKYAYTPISMLVATEEGRFVGVSQRADKDQFIEAELKAGGHLIQFCTPWKRNVNKFTFSVYGRDRIQI